jgi:hypothetical protein
MFSLAGVLLASRLMSDAVALEAAWKQVWEGAGMPSQKQPRI